MWDPLAQLEVLLDEWQQLARPAARRASEGTVPETFGAIHRQPYAVRYVEGLRLVGDVLGAARQHYDALPRVQELGCERQPSRPAADDAHVCTQSLAVDLRYFSNHG